MQIVDIQIICMSQVRHMTISHRKLQIVSGSSSQLLQFLLAPDTDAANLLAPFLHNKVIVASVRNQESNTVILHDSANLKTRSCYLLCSTPMLEIDMPNLRVYGAVDAVHLCDEHLHVHEPLDGSDDGGDDAHGFVGSYRDAAHVT